MSRKVFTAGEVLAAADVNRFQMDQTVMSFAGTAARGSAIPSPVEGMTTYLEDSNLLQSYNSSAWITVGNAGISAYSLVQILYFTSSGTFTKATYPWLRGIKVTCVGAGGAGEGNASGSRGCGGGGAGLTAITFITDIAGLDSSITVTRGAGATGGTSSGSAGGSSSFGSLVSANGGGGGSPDGGAGAGSGTGDINIVGGPGAPGGFLLSNFAGIGGSSAFGGGAAGLTSFGSDQFGNLAPGIGGGGGGARGASGAVSGGNGGNGLVVLELYA
jgi:hypothetical protein